jgi:hypothetical protein
MLFKPLLPAAPTPKTVIRGFNWRMSGVFKLLIFHPDCTGGSITKTPFRSIFTIICCPAIRRYTEV